MELDYAFWVVLTCVAGRTAKEMSWPLGTRFDLQPYAVLAGHLESVAPDTPDEHYSFGLACAIAGVGVAGQRVRTL